MKLTNEICISFLQGSGWLLNHDKEITISERNKAIDDFVENISVEILERIIWGMLVNSDKDNNYSVTSEKIVDYVIDIIKEVAEQLKEGGENE